VSDVTLLSIREVAVQVVQGNLRAEEIARAYAEKIEACESEIHAWQHFDRGAVIQQARRIDTQGNKGPLAGVPVGVKDVMDTFDMPTTYGSPIYAGHCPEVDAAVVAAIRSVDGIIFGKTVTTEFATFKPGPTINPCSLGTGQPRTPGGSSSGSAAAVAAGMVPIALATQTAASIVRPAAYCGIVGFKPTFNTLPSAGVKFLSPSLDTIGVLARSVDDAAFFVGTLVRREFINDPNHRLRIGICQTPHWRVAEQASRQALEEACGLFSLHGATVTDISLPQECESMAEEQIGIMGFEALLSLAPELAQYPEQISDDLRAVLDKGAALGGPAYVKLIQQAEMGRQAMATVFQDVDIIVAPSATGEAPLGLEDTGNPIFGRMWSLAGNPCVHVPTGVGPSGMPVGVTVIAPRWKDELALSAAATLENIISTRG
jgi:Asp-tRNA(Asn)/Glu-tRNA(Gln) amidotransferase A subunit family amidase